MKKLTALLLALILLLTLAACAEEPAAPTEPTTEPTTEPATEPTQPSTEPTEPPTEPTEPFVPHEKFDSELCADVMGEWNTMIVLDGSLLNISDLEGSASFMLSYHFYGTGEYEADVHGFNDAIAEYEDLIASYMFASYYSRFAGECKLKGMNDEQIEAAWIGEKEEQSRADALKFVADLSLAARFAALIRQGDYYVEEGRLYTANGDGTYESCAFSLVEQDGLSGLLSLDDTDNPGFYRTLGIEFPLVLNPVLE